MEFNHFNLQLFHNYYCIVLSFYHPKHAAFTFFHIDDAVNVTWGNAFSTPSKFDNVEKSHH